MADLYARAVAHPNIALIKYWGNREASLRLPTNGSISMNLAGLQTCTCVDFDQALEADSLTVNDQAATDATLKRVTAFLDEIRRMADLVYRARVESESNFPAGVGLASSAAAFAALALAASQAAGLNLSEAELSRLARRGSGSACRSIPSGFVEWQVGTGDADSYAFSLATPEHWGLVDCIAIVSSEHKATGSTQGHAAANSSPLQAARVADAPRRLDICRQAILEKDFHALAGIVELDSNLMHAVMLTSTPALIYWQPATLAILQAVIGWRREGLAVCTTIDAGPNVHVICEADKAAQVARLLANIAGVERVLQTGVGGPAQLEGPSKP